MRLLTELRRRNVLRMAGLYLVGAWLLAQVAKRRAVTNARRGFPASICQTQLFTVASQPLHDPYNP